VGQAIVATLELVQPRRERGVIHARHLAHQVSSLTVSKAHGTSPVRRSRSVASVAATPRPMQLVAVKLVSASGFMGR